MISQPFFGIHWSYAWVTDPLRGCQIISWHRGVVVYRCISSCILCFYALSNWLISSQQRSVLHKDHTIGYELDVLKVSIVYREQVFESYDRLNKRKNGTPKCSPLSCYFKFFMPSYKKWISFQKTGIQILNMFMKELHLNCMVNSTCHLAELELYQSCRVVELYQSCRVGSSMHIFALC